MAGKERKPRTPEEKQHLIEYALLTAYELGFTLKERALLLGYSEEVGDNPQFLHRELTELGKGEDIEKRCETIAHCDALLEKVGYQDWTSKKQYIRTERLKCLNDNTFYDWLRGGVLDQMTYADEQLMYMST